MVSTVQSKKQTTITDSLDTSTVVNVTQVYKPLDNWLGKRYLFQQHDESKVMLTGLSQLVRWSRPSRVEIPIANIDNLAYPVLYYSECYTSRNFLMQKFLYVCSTVSSILALECG